MKLNNPYLSLGEQFFEKSRPTPVANPQLVLWNAALAEALGYQDSQPEQPEQAAQYFSGNQLLPGSEPLSMAYAGHQFGNFVPQLGDGRAHYLGDVNTTQTKGLELQLKGSGRTWFSRGGDGRCGLGPAVREFIISEAMAGLGVPTARSLAVVSTGENVFRERSVPGAVVTRVSASHIRVGTFQFFAAKGDYDSVKTLVDLVITKHYPELQDLPEEQKALALFESVFERLIDLVVQWMRVGFIHGVMNTDNTMISGETLDYGPCAMMGAYNPLTVYSSIDAQGRYAFGNQPALMRWNLARFAECLLPLINQNTDEAIKVVEPVIDSFQGLYAAKYKAMMANKIGLNSDDEGVEDWIGKLLKVMEDNALDYTNTFFKLRASLQNQTFDNALSDQLGAWYRDWYSHIENTGRKEAAIAQMARSNPAMIPRNHHVERLISQAVDHNDFSEISTFIKALANPYELNDLTSRYMDEPVDGDKNYRTFCGT